VDPDLIVGAHVNTFWDEDDVWYSGKTTLFVGVQNAKNSRNIAGRITAILPDGGVAVHFPGDLHAW